MTTVYVAMIADRHSDPEPYVFSTRDAAIDYARQFAEENAPRPQDFVEDHVDGWLYYATYTVEDDCVWVIEKALDAPDLLGEEEDERGG